MINYDCTFLYHPKLPINITLPHFQLPKDILSVAILTGQILSLQSGLGLSDISGSYVDGIFVCRFTRKKHLPDEKQIFDLNNDFYMFFASGEAIDG